MNLEQQPSRSFPGIDFLLGDHKLAEAGRGIRKMAKAKLWPAYAIFVEERHCHELVARPRAESTSMAGEVVSIAVSYHLHDGLNRDFAKVRQRRLVGLCFP